MHLLKQLKVSELKVFLIICYESEGGVYRNLEKMEKYGITPPTIYSSVERLVQRKIVGKTQDGGETVLTLQPPFDQYAAHLLTYQGDLCAEKEEAEKVSLGNAHRDIVEVIEHYARVRDVPADKHQAWVRQQVPKLYNSARFIYKYAKGLQEAKKIVDRAKQYYTRQGTPWSLAGAVVDNIQIFDSGETEASPEVRKVIAAYKILKGMAHDDKGWDERHHDKAVPVAKAILSHFENDVHKAVGYMEDEVQYLKKENLSYNMDTLAMRVQDWEERKKKRGT